MDYKNFKPVNFRKDCKPSYRRDLKLGSPESINFQPYRHLGRIEDDRCEVTQREVESHKPLKYYTTNFQDKDFEKISIKSINFSDGLGIPSSSIDDNTRLRSCNTVMNLPITLPALPLATTPAKTNGFGQGCVDIEQQLRPQSDSFNSTNSCRPRDENFNLRSFQIFDNLCLKPQTVKHTVQKNHTYRGGVDTRQACD